MGVTALSVLAEAFIAELREQSITVVVRGDRIGLAPATAMTPDRRERIRELKPELLRLLSAPTLDVHERPRHGCYHCGRRAFVRVRHGPMWICPVCQGPRDLSVVVETWEAPEPSLRAHVEVQSRLVIEEDRDA